MNTENQKTIADIITEARGVFDELRKHGYNVVSVDRMADIIDRVEESHKREREAGAEAGAEAAQICGEIGEMVGREASKNQSVTKCNRLGNAARMREALEKADAVLSLISKSAWFIDASFSVTKAVIEACNEIEDALAEPPRNCDVGTPEEQVERFQWFCDTRPCDCCTLKNKVNETLDCAIHWAQMPYEEGDTK